MADTQMTTRQKLDHYVQKTYDLAREYHSQTSHFIDYFWYLAKKLDDDEMCDWYSYCRSKLEGDPRAEIFYRWEDWEAQDEENCIGFVRVVMNIEDDQTMKHPDLYKETTLMSEKMEKSIKKFIKESNHVVD